jgi:hypothetical protein
LIPVSINAVYINGGVVGPDFLIFDGTTLCADFPLFPGCGIKLNTVVPMLELRAVAGFSPVTC